MAITITVETGAVVVNANSYASLAEVRAFCVDRGLTLPVGDETVKAAMLLAMDYIESFNDQFKGVKTALANPLSFPRNRMKIDGYVVGSAVVPIMLKNAQCRASFEITNSIDLQPIIEGIALQEDTVGPITTKYQDFLQTVDGKRIVESVDSFIRPMLIFNPGYRLGRNGY